ncbi:MAG: NAD(P)/FAD-dependent oxidoreductase [Caulobacteraceae bacterium]|nr:NAD(P)/FAD-dependent oxidoreductase [Caulobacteraceae bacterium]
MDGKHPHVVVVGAGFGGLAVVHGLRHGHVDITLVDRQNHHLFQPLLYQVATAALSPADIAAPIRAIVNRNPRIRVLLDEVTGVAAAEKRVLLASGATLDFDILVLATGARHSYFGADHWSAHAPGVKTIDDATRVRRSILLAMERAETSRQRDLSRRDDLLTFVIIGGGPTGVEMAGAIAELTRRTVAMDFRFIAPSSVRILLIEAGPRILPSFPESLSAAAKRALETLGVVVRLGEMVTDIDEAGVMVGDERIETATVIWAAGVQASAAGHWLAAPTDHAGRVVVEPDLTAPGHPDIFVIGDTAAVMDADGRPVPGVAPAAKQQGQYVARVLAARLAGRAPPPPFRYRNQGLLATIGRQHAVIDFGWVRLRGLLAWLLWSTAHIYFLVGFRNRLVVAANWLWSYFTYDRGARLITGLVADEDASDHHRSSLGPASAPIAQGTSMPSEYQIATKGAPTSGQ